MIQNDPSYPAATGRLDHIAFFRDGLKEMWEHPRSRDIKFDERVLPRLNMTRLFYLNPDGIAVACNFDARETQMPGMKGY